MAIGEEFTRRLLVDAGIGRGMRVVDIGCGIGDVALLASELVGGSGEAVGLDRNVGPLAVARERASSLGITNVLFAEGDFESLSREGARFDAAVGRRVLMYQPDAVVALTLLARAVRSGGLVVFHEHDATMVPASLVSMPLHQQAQTWIREMLQREGANLHMGFDLYAALTKAGLAVEQVRAEAIVATPGIRYDVAGIVRAVLPRIVSHGVASEDAIAIDTLERRLDEERISTNATYVGDIMFWRLGKEAQIGIFYVPTTRFSPSAITTPLRAIRPRQANTTALFSQSSVCENMIFGLQRRLRMTCLLTNPQMLRRVEVYRNATALLYTKWAIWLQRRDAVCFRV